jgi:hypothetical protein
MRFAPRLLLGFSAFCLATGALVHVLAFPKAAGIVEHSILPVFFVAAFKGLWLSDSVSSIALSLAIGAIAVFPRMASRSLVTLLSLVPLTSAITIFATMGNFFAGYVMLLSGAAILIGGALHGHGSHPAAVRCSSASRSWESLA